ncbi:hypothetical protein Godav_011099 [Gossypium davidsonii]|nr:hypothetical protein [Gossypium davidsonii]
MILVMALCLTQSLITHSILNKCHVHVINGFSDGEILEAHCRSKDDDLGSATSPPTASSIGHFALISSDGPSSAATCGGSTAKSTLMSYGSTTSSSPTSAAGITAGGDRKMMKSICLAIIIINFV